MIRHHIFLDDSSQLRGGSSTWHVIVAGYLVMGLFDSWHRIEPVELINDTSFENVSYMVDAISPSYRAEKMALQKILQLLAAIPCTAKPCYIIDPFLAYGLALEHELRWRLAVDVYQTIAEAFELDARSTERDFATASYARRRAGFCLRNVADYKGAELTYGKALALGKRSRNDGCCFYARIGIANMTRYRGDIPGAISALETILNECDQDISTENITTIRSDIFHTLAVTKHLEGEYAQAISHYVMAYTSSPDPVAKEFILGDLGGCFEGAGFRNKARHAFEVVASTATSHLARQTAIVNLMEIEVSDGNQIAFARWKKAWDPEYCDIQNKVHGRLHMARGVKKFGDKKQAWVTLHEAADFAAEAGIQHVELEARHEAEALQ